MEEIKKYFKSQNWNDIHHDPKKEFKLLVAMMDGKTYGL